MKLASLVHPSREWPRADGLRSDEEPLGTYTVLCAEYGLGSFCHFWYQGPSLFRALLAYARVYEFSDTTARYCAYLDSKPLSSDPRFEAVRDAAFRKCHARFRRRSA
jgi:hypothetical protein